MANVSSLHHTDSVLNQNDLAAAKHSNKNNLVQNPPKRSKHDTLESTLERYLKRRNYNYKVENSKIVLPTEACIDHSAKESIAISKAIMNNNSIVFSYVNIDAHMLDVVDQQFAKLQHFVKNLQNVVIKEELLAIIPVMLGHLYLEILKGTDKATALGFLEKHSSTFLQNGTTTESHYDLLCQLRSIVTVQDISSQPLLALFRSSKHITNISAETAIILRKFLSKHGHSIILHILNKWFHYELKSGAIKSQDTEGIEKLGDSEATSHVKHFEEEQQKSSSEDLLDLVTSLKKINLTRVTSLLNADGATCAISDCQTSAKAVGLKNSEIILVRNNVDYIKLEQDSSDERLEIQHLRSHGNSITDIKFAQQGRLMLSASQDDTARLWTMNNGKCINIYTGHQYPIWSLAVSSNDQYFATGSFDNTARLWTLERRHPLRVFTAHTQSVQCVAFHKNGKYVATGSRDATVRLFSILDGSVLRLMSDATSPIYSVSFNPDGKIIAGAGEDGIIYMWDLAKGSCLYKLVGHTGTVCCMTWDADSNHQKLYTGTTNGEVKLWTKQNESWQSTNLYNEGDYKRILNVEVSPFYSGSHIFALPSNESNIL